MWIKEVVGKVVRSLVGKATVELLDVGKVLFSFKYQAM